MKNFRMKSIRTLSLLLALAMVATVGGVYAAWSYADSAGVAEQVNKGVSLTPATRSGSIGEYEILYSEFLVALDQTAEGDYTPKLSLYAQSDDGSLNFTFTPTIIASDEVKEKGIESTVTFSSSLTHEGIEIFSFPDTIKIGKVNSTETYKWTKEADGSFTCSIPNADLYNYIKLNYTDKLDTYAKYQAMETSLSNGTIVIKIANGSATASSTD